MSATPYVTGPVYCWLGFTSRILVPTAGQAINFAAINISTWSFLGTAQRAPRRKTRIAHEPLWNDVSGSKVPYDQLYEGAEGLIGMDLTKWDWAVYRRAAAQAGGGTDGTDDEFARGSLRMTEGKFASLALVFPYYAKSVFRSNGMVPGYLYPVSYLIEDDELEPGTAANVLHLMWYCQSAFNTKTQRFTLFTNKLTGVPLRPPS